MPRRSRYNANSLVYEISWYLEGFPSCCSVDTPIRLEGSYVSPEDHKREVIRAAEGGNPPDTPTAREIRLRGLHQYIEDACEVDQAVPIWVAFAGILQRLKSAASVRQRMFICTDNMRGTGDVHTGPFSTKTFMQWLIDNELANVTSHDVGYMRSWSFDFVGKFILCNRMIAKATRQIVADCKVHTKLVKDIEVKHSFPRSRRRSGGSVGGIHEASFYRDEEYW